MQLEFFDVPSPCVGVCQSDEKGYCLGCMRSRDERQKWQAFDSDKKQKVIKLCIQRKKRKQNKASKDLIVKSEETSLEENETVQQPSLLDPPSKPVLAQSSDLDFGDFEL
ncbi:MAG: DUF1289 domain-containing protein [Colwellia sp.]|nr:DUF1289 domain-containing protein [Colwellia sp.]MCW8866085.1 DUF1289 domain-containing protein [Colwellia sp.]MCW9083098.1 DUF1289 domain-containing protein [Colwellia sp.]